MLLSQRTHPPYPPPPAPQRNADELFNHAAKLLESFAYVGLGDDLHSSAELAASVLGRALDGPAYAHGELFIPGVKKVGGCRRRRRGACRCRTSP